MTEPVQVAAQPNANPYVQMVDTYSHLVDLSTAQSPAMSTAPAIDTGVAPQAAALASTQVTDSFAGIWQNLPSKAKNGTTPEAAGQIAQEFIAKRDAVAGSASDATAALGELSKLAEQVVKDNSATAEQGQTGGGLLERLRQARQAVAEVLAPIAAIKSTGKPKAAIAAALDTIGGAFNAAVEAGEKLVGYISGQVQATQQRAAERAIAEQAERDYLERGRVAAEAAERNLVESEANNRAAVRYSDRELGHNMHMRSWELAPEVQERMRREQEAAQEAARKAADDRRQQEELAKLPADLKLKGVDLIAAGTSPDTLERLVAPYITDAGQRVQAAQPAVAAAQGAFDQAAAKLGEEVQKFQAAAEKKTNIEASLLGWGHRAATRAFEAAQVVVNNLRVETERLLEQLKQAQAAAPTVEGILQGELAGMKYSHPNLDRAADGSSVWRALRSCSVPVEKEGADLSTVKLVADLKALGVELKPGEPCVVEKDGRKLTLTLGENGRVKINLEAPEATNKGTVYADDAVRLVDKILKGESPTFAPPAYTRWVVKRVE